MEIKIISTTDGRFTGHKYSGQEINEVIAPLVNHVGNFDTIEIISNKLILQNSNYLITAKILN